MKQITEVVGKLSISKGYTCEETQSKIEEQFYNGLKSRTKLEMARLNVHSYPEMFHLISTTEDTIEEQMQERLHPHNVQQHKYTDHYTEKNKRNYPRTRTNSHRYSDNIRHYPNQKNPQRIRNSYCDYHNTSTHSNETCRAQMKPYNQKNSTRSFKHDKNPSHNQQSTKNFLLEDKAKGIKKIEIPCTINKMSTKAIIDTGSESNIITKCLAKRLQITAEKQNNPIVIVTIGNETLSAGETAKFNLSFDSIPFTTFMTTAIIVDIPKEILLLGIKFLETYNCCIDLSQYPYIYRRRPFSSWTLMKKE